MLKRCVVLSMAFLMFSVLASCKKSGAESNWCKIDVLKGWEAAVSQSSGDITITNKEGKKIRLGYTISANKDEFTKQAKDGISGKVTEESTAKFGSLDFNKLLCDSAGTKFIILVGQGKSGAIRVDIDGDTIDGDMEKMLKSLTLK
jgi:hypothetical protein